MLPARFAPYLFALILSGMMSCMVSGVATLRAAESLSVFPALWMSAWVVSWAIAFPGVLLLAPVTRRIVARLTVAPVTA